MKYLIIGLGEFGKTLAFELTEKKNDVVAIDLNAHKVNNIKDKVSFAYIMDATEPDALAELPLNEIDCAIVAIGQSMDTSLRTVAALKENGITNIYARAIDDTHFSILKAMNIKHVFIPEKYAAQMYVKNY